MAKAVRATSSNTEPTRYDGFETMLLNGTWRQGRSGRISEDRDPYTNDVLVRIALADEQDLEDGFRAAVPPHVFVDATNDMSIAQKELFGPAVSIIKVQDEEEAVQVANATSYGLSAAVVTRDLERGARVARRLQAGMTHVNDSPVNDLPNCPFGGEKNSGLGRYNGEWSIEEFTTAHWISVQHEPIPYPLK